MSSRKSESEVSDSEVSEEVLESEDEARKRRNREYAAKYRRNMSSEKKKQLKKKDRERKRKKVRNKDNDIRLAGIEASKQWRIRNPVRAKELNDRHLQHRERGFVKYSRKRQFSPVPNEILRSSKKLPPKVHKVFNEDMKMLQGIRYAKEVIYFVVALPNEHPTRPDFRINSPVRVRQFLIEFPNAIYAYYVGIGRGRGLYIVYSSGRHWKVPLCNESSLAQIVTWYNHSAWLIRTVRCNSRMEVGVDFVSRAQQAEGWFQYVGEKSLSYGSKWMPLNTKIENSKFLSIKLEHRESAIKHAATGCPLVCVVPDCEDDHSPDKLPTIGPPWNTTLHLKDLVIRRFRTGICTKTNYGVVEDFLTSNKIPRKLVGEQAKKKDHDKGYIFDSKMLPPVEVYDKSLDDPFSDKERDGGVSSDDPDDSNDQFLDEDEGEDGGPPEDEDTPAKEQENTPPSAYEERSPSPTPRKKSRAPTIVTPDVQTKKDKKKKKKKAKIEPVEEKVPEPEPIIEEGKKKKKKRKLSKVEVKEEEEDMDNQEIEGSEIKKKKKRKRKMSSTSSSSDEELASLSRALLGRKESEEIVSSSSRVLRDKKKVQYVYE